jgi:hypothetical protein
MPAAQLLERQGDSERPGPDERLELIGRRVLLALGRPCDLLRVQVRPLWGNRYRVNVVVGKDPASARIDGSYFLAADEEGNVIESTPAIARRRQSPGAQRTR